ncbi:putative ribonuclease H-like domain-containing protein [Tanacetum coccineum]
MIPHSLSKIFQSSSMSFIIFQDVCLRQELLEYMVVHVNDASESSKPSWGNTCYFAYFDVLGKGISVVLLVLDDSSSKFDCALFYVNVRRLFELIYVLDYAKDRMWVYEGRCLENFTKKESMKKAFQDMLHGIGGRWGGSIENLIDLRVKVIRCDNGTEFKNRVMNQFCEMKGIKREFSVARTPQQNGVVERKNRTLIEAARTTLADSKLPTTFWAEAEKPALSFMRPFGCPVTILNTIDHLGKFDGKADEGFFVGYSTNSKAFIVFNSRTRIVEENLHVQFSENTSNIVGNGPNWLFDIDAMRKSMNYKLVVAGNQSNGNAGTKACDDAGKAKVETDSHDAGFKPSGEEEKKDAEDLGNESGNPTEGKVIASKSTHYDSRVVIPSTIYEIDTLAFTWTMI